EWALGDSDIAGLRDKTRELFVGHGVPIHPEAGDGDLVDGSLLRIKLFRSHAERPALDPGHVLLVLWHLRHRSLSYWPCVREASSLATAWSIVKLAACWRGGNSLNVSRNCPTTIDAVSTRMPMSSTQSQLGLAARSARSKGRVRRLSS